MCPSDAVTWREPAPSAAAPSAAGGVGQNMLLQALGASAADKEMRDILTCPISLEIMSDPVSCADGEHKTLTVTSGNLLIFLVYVCRFHQGAGCAVPRGIMLTLVVMKVWLLSKGYLGCTFPPRPSLPPHSLPMYARCVHLYEYTTLSVGTETCCDVGFIWDISQ